MAAQTVVVRILSWRQQALKLRLLPQCGPTIGLSSTPLSNSHSVQGCDTQPPFLCIPRFAGSVSGCVHFRPPECPKDDQLNARTLFQLRTGCDSSLALGLNTARRHGLECPDWSPALKNSLRPRAEPDHAPIGKVRSCDEQCNRNHDGVPSEGPANIILARSPNSGSAASDAIGKINVHRNTPADQTVRLPMRLMMSGIDNMTSTTVASKLNTAISGHHRTGFLSAVGVSGSTRRVAIVDAPAGRVATSLLQVRKAKLLEVVLLLIVIVPAFKTPPHWRMWVSSISSVIWHLLLLPSSFSLCR